MLHLRQLPELCSRDAYGFLSDLALLLDSHVRGAGSTIESDNIGHAARTFR
jgi:hypothetical protein